MSATTKARPLGSAPRARGVRPTLWLAARVLGALSLLAVGAVHLQQYFELYSDIPTIGTLFVLNFVGATIVGLGLLAPVERVVGRLGGAVLALLALAGTAQAATAFRRNRSPAPNGRTKPRLRNPDEQRATRRRR
jgi:hypothetical protein